MTNKNPQTKDFLLDDLLNDINQYHKGLIPVCSYDDCRKVRVNKIWIELPYKPNIYKYTYTYCSNCINRVNGSGGFSYGKNK